MKTGLTLHIHAEVAPDKARLLVQTEATNALEHEVYVFDRAWTTGARGVIRWDPHAPYRTVLGGSLRLLYGICPLPANRSVGTRYIPYATLLAPGASARIEAALAVPIDEYLLYAPQDDPEAVDLVEVSRVVVIAHWVEAGSAVTSKPSPLDPQAFVVDAPPRLVQVTWAEQAISPVAVRRRRDPISRFLLPGEEPDLS